MGTPALGHWVLRTKFPSNQLLLQSHFGAGTLESGLQWHSPVVQTNASEPEIWRSMSVQPKVRWGWARREVPAPHAGCELQRASKGLVHHEGAESMLAKMEESSEQKKASGTQSEPPFSPLGVSIILTEKTYIWQTRQPQGRPRPCLLNRSKGGISPNANEQRTIHVTQNIRYALNVRGCEAGR